MKRTPMSVARAVSNRKLTFAMIERKRLTASGTYCQRQIMPMQHEAEQALISETNQRAHALHVVPHTPSDKRYLPDRPDSGGHDREKRADVLYPQTFPLLDYLPNN